MPLLLRELGMRLARLPNRTTRGPRQAVTIVELVIVVMILGIMAAVAAPTFYDSLLYHRAESAAHRLKADLELARHHARLTSTTQSLTFSGTAYSLSSQTALDNANNDYIVDLAESPYELATVTADFNGTQSVSFDGYGTPSSAGAVTLTSQGHRCTVSLDGVTGHVTITSLHTRGNVAPVNGN